MAITALHNVLNMQSVVRNTRPNQQLKYYASCLEKSAFFVQKNTDQLHLMSQSMYELRESVVNMNRRLDRLEALMNRTILKKKVEPTAPFFQSKTGHVLPVLEDLRFTVS